MSDRTSAKVFGKMFRACVEMQKEFEQLYGHKMVVDYSRKFALIAWKLSQEYDFTPDQMGCDDVLIELGLARHSGDEYDEVEYADERGKFP